MNTIRSRFLRFAAASALAALPALAQAPPAGSPRAGTPGPGAARAPNPDSVVATVGPRRISRSEFESRYENSRQAYRARAGGELAGEFVPIARRQVLEGLIRRELLQLEASRRGVVVPEQEAEEEMKRDPFLQEGGVFSQARLDAVRTSQPQRYRAVIEEIRQRLGARRLQEQLNHEFTPPEAGLRADVERALTRAAISYLALRREEFSGQYSEPREAEVVEEYRARAARYRRPDRARISVAFLNTPEPGDAVRADAKALRAWSDQMRVKADEALAAVRAGTSLEDATVAFGTPRRDIVVTRDNFPGYWHADERLNGLLFAQRPGSVLPEPVPADLGWLLVRVDELSPAHIAPLSEVAPEIRSELRERARRKAEDETLRTVYQSLRDSMRTTAYRVRYAVMDTATMSLREPDAAALERYYRTHLAEYSTFDPATASVKLRPLAEVKDELRRGWMRDRRLEMARDLALRLEAAWRKGTRDRALEARAPLLREVGPVPLGVPADSGAAGRALGDSLARRAGALGVGAGPSPRGPMVFDVYQVVPDFVPTFEQARSRMVARRRAEAEREEERAARALYDQDPMRFASDRVVRFTRVTVPPPNMLDVQLTRAEVERYRQEHIERYSAPEAVHARHILISPTGPGPEADEKARAKAADLLRRIRGGEDFATLARLYTDDAATRESGGDLGAFARGVMLEPVERTAFGLRDGEISDPVKTEVGYHIIQCTGHDPAVAQPLAWMYANVGSDAAIEKAKAIARRRADSLYLVAGTPAKLRAAARKLGLPVASMDHTVGDRRGSSQIVAVLERLESLKPGEMYPGPHEAVGDAFAFSMVDSIAPPARPNWTRAMPRALEAVRRAAGQRALDAKIAELDSLARAGADLDSLAAPWGGLQKVADLDRGKGLPDLKGAAQVDSLVFGTGQPAALELGQVSGWLDLPRAVVRLRLDRWTLPASDVVAARVAKSRRDALEKKLLTYFDGLKRRYPVRILDRKLSEVALPVVSEP